MNNSPLKTLRTLLQECEVIIPIIQRDYAQGRKGKENLRRRFLDSLFAALKGNSPLVLDFVYGSRDENSGAKPIFYPLDGQQRLTTLWLLHWCLVFRAGTQEASDVAKTMQRFSYQTRYSSRVFCEKLCQLIGPPHPHEKTGDVVEFLRTQKWHYSSFAQDPTISSMLRMLAEIDARCHGVDVGVFWEKLWSPEAKDAAIRFYCTTFESDSRHTDELYIKMNDRGKRLTPFEIFKADLLKARKSILRDDFSQLMDTRWTDLFWENRSRENGIDEIRMTFFHRFFLCWHITHGTREEGTANRLLTVAEVVASPPYRFLLDEKNNERMETEYQGFEHYDGVATLNCLETLALCLDEAHHLLLHAEGTNPFRPYWEKESDSFSYIPSYELKSIVPRRVNWTERVVFWAICLFLKASSGRTWDASRRTSLADWMHFVWNMAENSSTSADDAMRLMRFLSKIATEHAMGIECWLAEQNVGDRLSDDKVSKQIHELLGYGEQNAIRQLHEEIIKARQKRAKGCPCKYMIERAEACAFFKGSIAFLYRDDKDNLDWPHFELKRAEAARLFDEKGCREECLLSTLTRFYSWCDDGQLSDKQVFNGKVETWKHNIFNKQDKGYRYVYREPLHQLLLSKTRQLLSEKQHWATLLLQDNAALVRLILQHGAKDNAMYIRSIHDFDALYVVGNKGGQGVYLNYIKRDTIFSVLQAKGELSLRNPADQCAQSRFIWGFDVDFLITLRGGEQALFRWYHRRANEREDRVFLMENPDAWRYSQRPNEKKSKIEKDIFYCFSIEDSQEVNTQQFCDKLVELATQRSDDRKQ